MSHKSSNLVRRPRCGSVGLPLRSEEVGRTTGLARDVGDDGRSHPPGHPVLTPRDEYFGLG